MLFRVAGWRMRAPPRAMARLSRTTILSPNTIFTAWRRARVAYAHLSHWPLWRGCRAICRVPVPARLQDQEKCSALPRTNDLTTRNVAQDYPHSDLAGAANSRVDHVDARRGAIGDADESERGRADRPFAAASRGPREGHRTRRIHPHHAARPGCCTERSSAAQWRMAGSSRSTPAPRRRFPASMAFHRG